MSATAEELPGAELDSSNPLEETVAYDRKDSSDSSSENSRGSQDMRPANSVTQAQGRYAFGSGARPLEGYTIKRAIGRGGFGEVYYATSDSGKEVALKLILRNLDVERRGVLQCMNLKCPNLLTIFDLKTSEGGDTFVVMEYVAGPSLASVLKQYPRGLPMPEVRHWLKGLVEGVAYLHDHGIVHRDLKPANLFMEEGIVKIGDYGLAKLITPSQGTEHSESIGTCHYMAPEIGSGKYHKPIDIYAMGVILYEMLTGRVPFDGETVNEVLMKHLTSRPDVSILQPPYQSIVAKALAKDPNHRPARVYDLLPPEDAPRVPEVRIIGDGRGGAGAVGGSRQNQEEVLRIEAEEPVFYIGPDTRPPREALTAGLGRRLKANLEALRRPRGGQRPPIAAAPTARAQGRANGALRQAAYVRPSAGSPPTRAATTAPPEPPPLPSTRVRVAELAGSMLWTAPVLALLTVPTAAMLGIEVSAQSQQLVYLYGMGLLGTWSALIPGKIVEARKIEGSNRRLIALAAGLVVGALAIGLGRSLRMGTDSPRQWYGHPLRDAELVYFAALYTFMGTWTSLAARARSGRFRFMPIVWTSVVAACLIPLWPYARHEGIAVAIPALIAATVQLVSPWNEASALYARYVRVRSKQNRQGKFV
jgi:eukaryotic-like serine/threonine-protein kinase